MALLLVIASNSPITVWDLDTAVTPFQTMYIPRYRNIGLLCTFGTDMGAILVLEGVEGAACAYTTLIAMARLKHVQGFFH
jgi:hypothetical protein